MATTTNFGWETPDDTDLVKDGAAAIRTALGGVDTSFVDLKGGTTGQVLAKASGTDLDFTWATDASGIPATIFDAKGDIIAASAADTAARLAVGANDTVLTADSSTATGLKWATAAPAGANWSLLNAGGTALTGATTITVSGISGKDKILILVKGAKNSSSSIQYKLRFNADTGSNYYYAGNLIIAGSTYSAENFLSIESDARDAITYGASANNSASTTNGFCFISGANASGVKTFHASGAGNPPAAASGHWLANVGGYYNSASTISSISVVTSGTNFSGGTVFVYTSA
jgi:hypothetical protein